MLENPEDPNTDAADEAVDAEGADGDEALDAADSSEGVEAELVELEPTYVRELRADLDAANSENDALQAQLNELKERLRAVSQAYQKQQDEVSATRERLERQAVVKEELRRGEVVSSLFEPVENLRRSLDSLRRGASAEDTATADTLPNGAPARYVRRGTPGENSGSTTPFGQSRAKPGRAYPPIRLNAPSSMPAAPMPLALRHSRCHLEWNQFPRRTRLGPLHEYYVRG